MKWLSTFFGLLAIAAASPDADRITEIRLERTPCFGGCPVDEVILRPDGTATYIGTRFVEKLGRHQGKFDRADFDKLAKLMESKGFFGLKDRYDRPITDNPSLITSTTRGGKTKRVVDYAKAGPDELKEIEVAIHGIMEKIEWRKEK